MERSKASISQFKGTTTITTQKDFSQKSLAFQKDQSLNTLTKREKGKIWIPKLIFNNTDDENSSVVDDKARLNVERLVKKSG